MNICTSHRKLYVIGNGFDLHHGLPCGYADFMAWLQVDRPKVYSTLNRIYGDCDGNNWSDFEESLASFNLDDYPDDVTRDDLMRLKAGLNEALGTWAKTIGMPEEKTAIGGIDRNAVFFTFNYTRTLEDFYGIGADRIVHLHGGVDNGNLIFGHDSMGDGVTDEDLKEARRMRMDADVYRDMVHVWVNNQFFENDEYEEYMDMLDEWSIDGYYDCYNWLLRCDDTSREKGRAAESANQVMAEFLSIWKRKAPEVFKEAIELMAYCAEHEFINMTPTLKERIDADWRETGTDEDKEGLYIKLLPYPTMLYRMFQDEKYEEAFANVFYLFERLADLEKRRPEMFRNVDSYMPKMEIISDILLEVYFQIKGCPNVSSDMKSDIDFFITELQGRYNYFNEASSRWDDMFDDENSYYGHFGDFWEWYVEELKRRNIEVQ